MAYQPHTLVTFGGTLTEVSGNDEIWECGIRGFNDIVANHIPVDQGQLQALVNEIATSSQLNLHDWFVATTSWMPTTAKLAWVKAVNINAAGGYSGDPAAYEWATPASGPHAQWLPSFNTITLGWTTGKQFGRARSGRVYPPNFAAVLDHGAVIQASVQTDLMNSALGLIGQMTRSQSQYQFTPFVVSKSGVSNKITGVRVPNVIDVQRRRKNAVQPTYAAAAIP